MKIYMIGEERFLAKSYRDAAEQWGMQNAAKFEHGASTVLVVKHKKTIKRMRVLCLVGKNFLADPEKK